MTTKRILANWKSQMTPAAALAWFDRFNTIYTPHPEVEVIIAPPFPSLIPLREKIQQQGIRSVVLAVQDLSPFPMGAYTGAVAAEMVRDIVSYALVGHSERRRYFHETDREVANKVREARTAGITPILCVDEPYARGQLAALDEEDIDSLIIGYGPVQAVGLDTPQSPGRTAEVLVELGQLAPGRPILYGGSINGANAADYLELTGVAGLMVATASLDPEEFATICRAVTGGS